MTQVKRGLEKEEGNLGQCTLSTPNFSGSPDIQFTIPDRMVNDSNFLLEISYGVGLREMNTKAGHYMTEFPGVMMIMVIDIGYPWDYVMVNGRRQDDADKGKMICYIYDRFDLIPDGPIVPSYAISFGNNPMTAADVERVVSMTHMNSANIRGHGIADHVPCNGENIPMYDVIIPGRVLFAVTHFVTFFYELALSPF